MSLVQISFHVYIVVTICKQWYLAKSKIQIWAAGAANFLIYNFDFKEILVASSIQDLAAAAAEFWY